MFIFVRTQQAYHTFPMHPAPHPLLHFLTPHSLAHQSDHTVQQLPHDVGTGFLATLFSRLGFAVGGVGGVSHTRLAFSIGGVGGVSHYVSTYMGFSVYPYLRVQLARSRYAMVLQSSRYAETLSTSLVLPPNISHTLCCTLPEPLAHFPIHHPSSPSPH
jgi:hypothetical protein